MYLNQKRKGGCLILSFKRNTSKVRPNRCSVKTPLITQNYVTGYDKKGRTQVGNSVLFLRWIGKVDYDYHKGHTCTPGYCGERDEDQGRRKN